MRTHRKNRQRQYCQYVTQCTHTLELSLSLPYHFDCVAVWSTINAKAINWWREIERWLKRCVALWWIFRVWHIRFILWREHTFDMFSLSLSLCTVLVSIDCSCIPKLCAYVRVCDARWSIFGNLSLASAKCISACAYKSLSNAITLQIKYQMSTKRREWH